MRIDISDYDVRFSHRINTRKSRNHTVIKFATFVRVVCDTICTKFCNKRTSFDKDVKIHHYDHV